MIDKLRYWLLRKTLKSLTPIDYTLKPGEWVYARNWSLGKVKIVSINWALRAAAVKLGENGDITVWSLWSLHRGGNE